MKIGIEHVYYMPKTLEPDILYISKEFKTAAHLCACGCGAKIRTPLTATEWSIEETEAGPTLRPSIGNWQQKCQSHYWIIKGEIIWSDQWTPEQIMKGREFEDERRRIYYEAIDKQNGGILSWFVRVITRIFR